MLKIFNELKPFFEDVYREISVRQYAKEVKTSPPTASKKLRELERENLLISTRRGVYIYFRANREGFIFRQLARLYWYSVFHSLTEKIHEEIAYKRVILFGSLSKAENTLQSDADIYLEAEEKKMDISDIQKKLKRDVQLHFIKSLRNENLRKNIDAGIIIR